MTRENSKLISAHSERITGMDMLGSGKTMRVCGRNAAVRQLLANDRHERATVKLAQKDSTRSIFDILSSVTRAFNLSVLRIY